MLVRLRFAVLGFWLALPVGCATTERSEGNHGDDDPIDELDAGGFIDATPVHVADASTQPGWPDAAPIVFADAGGGQQGPFCSADSQCNTSAHECCFMIIPGSGICTYGDVIPILGCFPADPPDAGM